MLIDMPVEQLKRYFGSSPRPADFDRYWEESLAELDAVDPQLELKPAEFQASAAPGSSPNCCARKTPPPPIRR